MQRQAQTFAVILLVLAGLLTSCGRRDEPIPALVTPTALPTYTPVVAAGAEAEAKTEAAAPAADDGEAEAELVEMAAAAKDLGVELFVVESGARRAWGEATTSTLTRPGAARHRIGGPPRTAG